MDPIRIAVWTGKRYHRRFLRMYPEDFRQEAEVVAFRIQREGMDVDAAFSFADREFHRAADAYGLGARMARGQWVSEVQLEGELVNGDRGISSSQSLSAEVRRSAGLGRSGEVSKTPPGIKVVAEIPCGVPGCTEKSLYNDDRYERLCKLHKSIVNTRRRRGWADPYAQLETARKNRRKPKTACGVPGCGASSEESDPRFGRICNRHACMRNRRRRAGKADEYEGIDDRELSELAGYIPSGDRTFWAAVRLGVSSAEWVAMWLWARGETNVLAPGILEKARKAAGKEVESVSS